MWTRFMDMHSGGRQKEKWDRILIEAPQKEAEVIFYNRFGHSPNRVTCTCCGEDYSISEDESLEKITAFDRNDYVSLYKAGSLIPLSDYLLQENVLVIRAESIAPEEKNGEVPVQGYVWM